MVVRQCVWLQEPALLLQQKVTDEGRRCSLLPLLLQQESLPEALLRHYCAAERWLRAAGTEPATLQATAMMIDVVTDQLHGCDSQLWWEQAADGLTAASFKAVLAALHDAVASAALEILASGGTSESAPGRACSAALRTWRLE